MMIFTFLLKSSDGLFSLESSLNILGRPEVQEALEQLQHDQTPEVFLRLSAVLANHDVVKAILSLSGTNPQEILDRLAPKISTGNLEGSVILPENKGITFETFITGKIGVLTEIKKAVEDFVELSVEGCASVGLYLNGVANVGKTHLAAAARESFLLKGKNVLWLKKCDIYSFSDKTPYRNWKYDVVIIDNLNEFNAVDKEFIRDLISFAHDTGGKKIVVTSNKSFKGFLSEVVSGNSNIKSTFEEEKRYLSRTDALFKEKIVNFTDVPSRGSRVKKL